MPVIMKSPIALMAAEAGTTDFSIKITNYDETEGVISGYNFGNQTGTVYLLDRDTHTYNALSVDSWSDEGISLSTPIDLSTITGTTCIFVRTVNGGNSNKFLITGRVSVPNWGIIYIKSPTSNTITKLSMTSSTDMAALVGTSSTGYFFGKSATVDGVTFNTSQIVGVQFGTSVSSYSIPAYFLEGLLNLDQPVVLRSAMSLTNSSTYFMFNCRNFNCPLVLTTSHVRFGNYFLGKCYSFNQPLDLSKITYWTQTYFMWNCAAFNNEIKLTTTLNSSYRGFGANFMNNCMSFNQPLTLPTNTNQIFTGFLYNATAFNQPITFPSITTMNTYFMAGCLAFNQPLDFSSSTFTSLGNYTLYMAKSYNSIIKLPTTCTTIGTYFLAGITGTTSTAYTNMLYSMSFNQPLDISKVTTIGNYFLSNCVAFNQSLDLTKVTSIGTYFMQNCTSFSQPITIPSGVTSIGTGFMVNILTARSMTVNTSTTPPTASLTASSITSASAPTQINGDVPAVTVGVTLYGTQRAAWISALPNSTATPWRNLINGGS